MGCKKIINVQNKVKGFYSCTPRRQTVYLWPDVGWPFLWKHFVIFIILNKMFAVRFNDSQRWPPICQKKKSWTQPWRMHEYWWNKKCQPVLLPSLNIDSVDTWHFCRSPPWEIPIGELGHQPSAPSFVHLFEPTLSIPIEPQCCLCCRQCQRWCCIMVNAPQKTRRLI